MPIQVNDGLRRVTTQPQESNFTSAGVPARTFSQGEGLASLGNALGEASDIATKMKLQMQEEDNTTAAKEADSRMAERVRKILSGDPKDSANFPGYLNSKGATATDTFAAAESALQTIMKEELATAGRNRSLAEKITQQGQRRLDNALSLVTTHAGKERVATQLAASEAREAQAAADVSALWQDPETLQSALSVVQAETMDRAEVSGLTEDQAKQELLTRQSIVVGTAFDAAVSNDDYDRAQEVFSKHNAKLTGVARNAMTKVLVEGRMEEAAQRIADEAFAASGGNPEAARRIIRDSSQGKTRSTAMQTLRNRISDLRGDFSQQQTVLRAQWEAHRRQLDRLGRDALEEARERVGGRYGNGNPEALRIHLEQNYEADVAKEALSQLATAYTAYRQDQESPTTQTEAGAAALKEARAALGTRYGEGDPEQIRVYLEDHYPAAVAKEAKALFQTSYTAYRGDLTAPDIKAIREDSAQAEVDRIMGTEGLSPGQQRAEARKIEDVGLRNTVLDQLKERQSDKESDVRYEGTVATLAQSKYDRARKAELREEEDRLSEARSGAIEWMREGKLLRDYAKVDPDGYTLIYNNRVDPNASTRLESTERALADGRRFRSVSDETTYNRMISTWTEKDYLRPGVLDEYEPLLTSDEHARLVTKVDAARREKKAREERSSVPAFSYARSVLNNYFQGMKKKQQPLKVRADAELVEWIEGYNQSHDGHWPDSTLINEKAAEIMIEVEAGNWNPFVEDMTGRGFDIDSLTPDQRADLQAVSWDRVPEIFKAKIRRIVSRGFDGVAFDEISDGQLEELAGAILVGDDARIIAIMRKEGGTEKPAMRERREAYERAQEGGQ